MNSSTNRLAITARTLTAVLAGIFILAGMFKWSDPAGFEVSIIHLDIFPDWMIQVVASVIPIVEIIVGVMCLTSVTSRFAIAFLCVLTAAYTLVLFSAWLKGIEPSCACFGPQSSHWPYPVLFGRNFGLMTLEVFLLLSHRPRLNATPDAAGKLLQLQ